MDFNNHLKSFAQNYVQVLTVKHEKVGLNKRSALATMLILIGALAVVGCSQPAATVEESAAVIETSNEVAEEAMEEEAMAEGSAGTYIVSSADSTVTWTGSKPVGSSHTGVIDITEGELTLADGSLVSGSFVLDMASISATDGSPDRLIQHLNSDDFFGTATFPTASLVINSAESLGGDSYAVSGDLTIKEITNPIEFTATATEVDGVVSATADLVFDRALYDVQFGSGSFFSDLGDDLINDEVEITVELVAQN